MIEICDQHGQKVSDSEKQLSNKIESFANLQSFKSAMTGKLGSNAETINGTKMYVAYSPVKPTVAYTPLGPFF
jgi:hypothetical protein